MLRIRLFAIVFVAAVYTTAARAQTFAGLGAGLSVPTGELGRIDKPGFQLLGVWQSITPLKSTGFRIDASFISMQRKATIREISERIASVSAGPVLRFPRIAVSYAYVTATAGAYNYSTSPAPIGSSSSTDLGISLGGGLRFPLGKRKAFAEARYHKIMSSGGPRFVPLTFGIAF
jgi:hypothetical protein